jgi:flagellum-specific ATP synthase
LRSLLAEIKQIQPYRFYGRVVSVQGLLIEISGIPSLSVGARLNIYARHGQTVVCEVIGFRQERALCMPFGPLDGIGLGCKVDIAGHNPSIRPSNAWLGRVINGMGEPIDGKGPLDIGPVSYSLRASPPPSHERQPVGGRLNLGVRAINSFATCCRGQRMGIFAGSGVGKSVLLSMLAKNTENDVAVVGLIGERGREVREFIEENLGEEGLAHSVIIVATSDESALMRRQAAYLTLSVAEYFRDQELDVLCLMDSVTRFAMAQREIGLSTGEPPTSKGYTPTVFSELPKLLERAGPGVSRGSITGLFTVLVEGDDNNEPIADAVRSILDGHIVLDRAIAERGRYPAINVLRSLSRTTPKCNRPEETALITRARKLLAVYEDMAEMVRLGAYRAGADAEVDEAVRRFPLIDAFIEQGPDEPTCFEAEFSRLCEILG